MTSGQFAKSNTRNSKLTAEKVLKIRQLYAKGASQGALARAAGISVNQVGRIVRNECWQQVPEVPTDRDVDLTMVLNEQAATQVAPPALNDQQLEESVSRFRRLLGDTEPVAEEHFQRGRFQRPHNTGNSVATDVVTDEVDQNDKEPDDPDRAAVADRDAGLTSSEGRDIHGPEDLSVPHDQEGGGPQRSE